MFIDGFMFYNEIDLLYYRLSILYNVVDYFIICEATATHTGNPKPLYYQENKERFKEFHNKIIHIVVDDLRQSSQNKEISGRESLRSNCDRGKLCSSLTTEDFFWNENYHRDCIDRGIKVISKQMLLSEDTLIHISDADEIINPFIVLQLSASSKMFSNLICSIQQDLYYYNLHTRVLCNWACAKVAGYKYYSNEMGCSPQKCRMTPCQMIQNGGWHLSYFGDNRFIQNKIKSICEQNYNTQENTDLEMIQERMTKGEDIYGRKGEKLIQVAIETNDRLPPRYEELLKKFI